MLSTLVIPTQQLEGANHVPGEGLKFPTRSRLLVMRADVEVLDVGGVCLGAVFSRSMKRGPQLFRACPDTPRL
jgi:hypothetical protein